MFAFLTSPEKKARERASRLIELARTVWNFRRDLLAPADAAELTRRRDDLQGLVRSRAGAVKLEPSARALEAVLRKTGGAIYPRSSLAENLDFFLVALILIIGVRSYFLQPMVIPTNSMLPTYFGMTAETFPPDGRAPGPLARVARLAAFAAVRHETDSPAAGEVSALFGLDANRQPRLVGSIVEGRSWFVLPAKFAEYTLIVNDQPVAIRVPEDFHDFDQVLMDTYFHGRAGFLNQWRKAQAEGRVRELSATGNSGQIFRVYEVPLGKSVNVGDPLIRFDLLRGDMLFVDRFSYHFVRPKVGSAFVFETENIPLYASNDSPDEFLIKRLVGTPGDILEIKEPVLYRNGKPIEGAAAFDSNARREGLYRGYFNAPEKLGLYLLPGQSATVPPHSFMGLGDNSPISEDGRYWGFVPEKDVIGRPLFVYYPFTRRWGLAR